ncbi:xylulokinase [Salmonella enterica subsp. enterica]|nr:xylulokinase [Salmonella enterica subsp. enterica serovar Reading]MLO26018.1 xylulokinase [Salmonella enterica subsp. enterica serovar Reading]
MELYAGIDCGTQGTKVIIINPESGSILGTGSAPHKLITDSNGRREQFVHWWTDALCIAFKQAVSKAGISPKVVKTISVSAQQHGFVPLDGNGIDLYPAKLWCDTETSMENAYLMDRLGGEKGALRQLGLTVATGYTASKIIWFRKNHPELWQKMRHVVLPHEYINFWLTGELFSEYGDASGTGLFNIRSRTWNTDVINLVDDSGKLLESLPLLVCPGSIIGNVNKRAIELLGLHPQTTVACGSGDNMMGAIGTGNISSGIVTMGLGTSGTLYSNASERPEVDSTMVANFCSATNGWLPLICTMNVTSATSNIQSILGITMHKFEQLLSESEVGAGGVKILPFFNGERIPALPQARCGLFNLDSSNCVPKNICRAVVEGATFGLRYGLDQFRKQGIMPEQIRLTGGGAKSAVWRQIVADIMGCQVVGLYNDENTALGAAIHAAWSNSVEDLHKLCNKFIKIDHTLLCEPVDKNKSLYSEFYENYLNLLNKEYPDLNKE